MPNLRERERKAERERERERENGETAGRRDRRGNKRIEDRVWGEGEGGIPCMQNLGIPSAVKC